MIRPVLPSRRAMLGFVAVPGLAALAAPTVFASSRPLTISTPFSAPICHAAVEVPATVLPGTPRKLKLTWNASAICTVGVPVAQHEGLFREAQSRRRADQFRRLDRPVAGGDRHRQGGCRRRHGAALAEAAGAGLRRPHHHRDPRRLHAAAGRKSAAASPRWTDLKGKTVGVTDLGAPDKNFFSIRLAKLGIDPLTDVEWKVFPADLLPVALQKGEIQAFTLGDPLGWVMRDRDGLTEVATNLDGEYAHRACCVLGVRGSLIRDDKPGRRGGDRGDPRGAGIRPRQPGRGGRDLRPVRPAAKPEQLAAMLRSHTHGHHPSVRS